jgi:hypothetical protein
MSRVILTLVLTLATVTVAVLVLRPRALRSAINCKVFSILHISPPPDSARGRRRSPRAPRGAVDRLAIHHQA